VLHCVVRDNYAFITFAHYDGACSAVERKLSPVFSSFLVVYEVMRAVISFLSVVLVFFIVFFACFYYRECDRCAICKAQNLSLVFV